MKLLSCGGTLLARRLKRQCPLTIAHRFGVVDGFSWDGGVILESSVERIVLLSAKLTLYLFEQVCCRWSHAADRFLRRIGQVVDQHCVNGNVQRWRFTETKCCQMNDTAHANGHVSSMLPPFLAVVVKWVLLSQNWSVRCVVPWRMVQR